MPRIGVLGAGEIASVYVEGLKSVDDAELEIVGDPIAARAKELGAQFGFRRTTTAADAILTDPNVDLAVVLTPHWLHARQVVTALQAGKDVICEKPMATSVVDCDAMIDAAAAAGRRLGITHALRGEFFYEHALESFRAGRLGALNLASFRWYTDEIARLDDPGHWKGTLAESGGGVLIDGGCHVADIANAFLGRARRVCAFGGRLVSTRDGVGEDTAAFSVEYESGAIASCAISFVAGRALRQKRFACGLDMELWGTDGQIEGGYRMREASFRRYCREHRVGEPDRAWVDEADRSEGRIDMQILQAFTSGAELPVTPIDARNAVAVVEAAYRSIETGTTQDVDWRES